MTVPVDFTTLLYLHYSINLDRPHFNNRLCIAQFLCPTTLTISSQCCYHQPSTTNCGLTVLCLNDSRLHLCQVLHDTSLFLIDDLCLLDQCHLDLLGCHLLAFSLLLIFHLVGNTVIILSLISVDD